MGIEQINTMMSALNIPLKYKMSQFKSPIFELGYFCMSSSALLSPDLKLRGALYCAFIVTNLKGLVDHV